MKENKDSGSKEEKWPIEALIYIILENDIFNVKEEAAEALVKIGTPAVGPLIKILKDKNADVRAIAVESLGKIGSPTAVESLISALKDEDRNVRMAAAISLGNLKNPRAIEPLLDALMDKHPEVQRKMEEALDKIADINAATPLIKFLSNIDSFIRLKAANLLDKIDWSPSNNRELILYLVAKQRWAILPAMGKEVLNTLINILKDKNPDVREKAVECLGKIKDPRTIEPLIKALKDDNTNVRKFAAWALGNTQDLQVLKPLIDSLGDRESVVRERIVEALGKIEDSSVVDPLIKALKDVSLNVRYAAAEALGNIGTPMAVAPLIDTLKDIRDKAVEALRKIGMPALKPLLDVLNTGDPDTQIYAALALGNIKDDRAAEALIIVLGEKNSKDREVRKAAAKSLGNIGSTSAVEPLIKALKDDYSEVEKEAVESLGKIGDIRAIKPLINILRNKNYFYKERVLKSLVNIGDFVTAEPFLKELSDNDCYIRQVVSKVLDEIGWQYSNNGELALYLAAKQEWDKLQTLGKEAVKPLINILNDKDRHVQNKAIDTLSKIITSGAVELIVTAMNNNDGNIRKIVAELLDKINWKPSNNHELASYLVAKQKWNELPPIGRDAVEPLINVLEDKDIYGRYGMVGAVAALGKIRDNRAVEPLINFLENKDIYDGKREAIEALGKIGDNRAVRPLINALKDNHSYVQEEAAKALGKIGDSKAVLPLINALKNIHSNLGEKAAEALGEIGDTRAVKPLVTFYVWRLNSYGVREKTKKDAKEVLEKIRSKIPIENRNFFCTQCYCRVERYKANIPSVINFNYYTCRKCHSTEDLIKGIEKIKLLIDNSFEEDWMQNESIFTVNWLKRKEPFDFDEIWIKDANDFDVEELVMKLRNDMDDKRRKRLSSIPVYLSTGLKLSQAKMNLLKDMFNNMLAKKQFPG